MQVTQVVTEADYANALVELRSLIGSEPDGAGPVSGRLEMLFAIAKAFEADRYPVDPADIAVR